jgi:AcrR family transcriptional regulator
MCLKKKRIFVGGFVFSNRSPLPERTVVLYTRDLTAPSITRIQQGEETRQNILRLAVDVASTHGLESLSIGELSKELGMSKSGLFAHFGSKEDLQIATIEAAEEMFGKAIIKPAHAAAPGLGRLTNLLEGYIRYLEQPIFSGGCFFAAAAAEFDDQPGRVRDRIALSMRKWFGMIEAECRHAVEAGQLDPATDPEQLAFELEAFKHRANFGRRLMADQDAFERARRGIQNRLRSIVTPAGRPLLPSAKTAKP